MLPKRTRIIYYLDESFIFRQRVISVKVDQLVKIQILTFSIFYLLGNLTYNYVSSSYGRYLTLDELIGNIAELALTTSPSVPSKAGTSILTRTTNVTAQSALAAVNKTAIFS